MFMAAAKALAELSPARLDARRNLLPPVNALREVAVAVAIAVAAQARREGLAAGIGEHAIADRVREKIWLPGYAPYQRIGSG